MRQNHFRGLVAVGCGIAASFGAAAMLAGCTGDDIGDAPIAKVAPVDSGAVIIDSGKKTQSSPAYRAGVIVSKSGAPACPSTQSLCGDSCATLSHDPQNCGACGVTCGAGEACSAGECTTTCGGEQSFCSAGDAGDAGSPYCATFASDNANCGGCGVACAAGEMCSNGSCQTTCGSSQTICNASGDAGAPYCATLASDEANCGACGTSCRAGESCSDGQCNVTCGATESLCSADGGASNGIDGGAAFCADFATENDNCGGCGIACGAGQMCSNGVCGTTCEGDLVQCGSKCVDPTSSMTSCGATAACDADAGTAGTTCDATTEACTNGICAALAPPPPAPTFVASFNVNDGPIWFEAPQTYTCVQACALLNGGDPSDYGCSTVPDSLNHLAWETHVGSNESCNTGSGTPLADDFSNGLDYTNGGFSAYAEDWCFDGNSINYCWTVSPTK